MTVASDHIESEAARWLIRLESEAAPEQWDQLDAWLNRNTLHRAAFLRLSASWRKADRMRSLRAASDVVDIDLLSKRAIRARRAGQAERPRWTFGLGLRTAFATAVAVVAVGITGYFTMRSAPAQTYATQVGEHRTLTLSDGSIVVLNTDTQLVVQFSGRQRHLTLARGEAAFQVEHDPQRPFDVRAGDNVFRAIGTAFSVRLHTPTNAEIRVTEGRVAVDPPFTQVLAAGDTAKVHGTFINVTKVPVEELTQKLVWTEGRLYFSNDSLADAVAEFNRYNRRKKLMIVDASIAGVSINGTFSVDAPEQFVNAVCEAYGVHSLPVEEGASTVIRLVGEDP